MQDSRQIPLARRFADEIKDGTAGPGWHCKRIGRRVRPCAVERVHAAAGHAGGDRRRAARARDHGAGPARERRAARPRPGARRPRPSAGRWTRMATASRMRLQARRAKAPAVGLPASTVSRRLPRQRLRTAATRLRAPRRPRRVRTAIRSTPTKPRRARTPCTSPDPDPLTARRRYERESEQRWTSTGHHVRDDGGGRSAPPSRRRRWQIGSMT